MTTPDHEVRPRPTRYGRQPLAPDSEIHFVEELESGPQGGLAPGEVEFEAEFEIEVEVEVEFEAEVFHPDDFTKVELMEKARERGLSMHGTKQDIIDRLEE